MAVFFTRLKVGWPDPLTSPEDWDGCWKVYTICIESNISQCTTRGDVRDLGSSDKRDARTSYHSLLQKAHTGMNFSDLYDEKQCHEAHSFKYAHHEFKIHRIWGAGVIRIYFLYLPNKCIVILKTWAKRKNKLTKGEEGQLEEMVKQVASCLQQYSFEAREIQ